MEPKQDSLSPNEFKIICRNYPSEFILDKNLAKEYFRQFGRIKKMTFKPRLRVCTVEYTSKECFLDALNNAGEYKGTFFQVTVEKSPEPKKKKVVKKPLWVDNDEVKAELEAMSSLAPKTYSLPEDLTDSLTETPKIEKSPKLKRAWTTESVSKQKKKTKVIDSQWTAISPEQLELINLVKSQATTVEEKYKILDARDKLIRIKLKKNTQLKSSPTIGTCPDMCPEKERLMRETQHQVALYEQTDNGKSMNQSKAVKQYSRSSADQEAPLPHELRPVSVLQMTMGYLMHNIIDLCDSSEVNLAEWFHFLWDRTRGIRKDITQQELCSQGAVELVEQCARFHIHCSARLVAEDPSVFDQKINTENLTKCLQSLKYMYHDLQLKGESCSNEAEFRAYIILLNLNDGNFMWEVQELRQEIQKSEAVKFALEVYSALDKNNYVKFFKLVYTTTYLNACILMRYFVQVRVAAIKTLLKCYTPRVRSDIYPLTELTRLLGFDDIDSTVDFMQVYCISINDERTHIILEKNTFLLPEFPYLPERSLNVVESKRTCSVGKLVCGKQLPPKTFERHIPQDSFDDRGYLILKDMLEDSDLEQSKIKESDLMDDSEMTDTDSVSQSIFSSTPSTSKDNIFGKKQESTNIFAQKSVTTKIGSIFAQASQEQAPVSKDNVNIFGKPVVESQKPVLAKQTDIFSKRDDKPLPQSRDQTDSSPSLFSQSKERSESSIWSPASGNIFSNQSSGSLFAKPSFDAPVLATAIPDKLPKATPIFSSSAGKSKGGFMFNLPKMPTEVTPNSIFGGQSASTSFVAPSSGREEIPISSIKMPITPEKPVEPPAVPDVSEMLELQRKKEEEKRKIMKRELEEEKRRKELEIRLLEEKRKEEERYREIQRRKQEEELRRRMDELRKEEERLKTMEIQRTVGAVVDDMVAAVAGKIQEDRLRELRDNIRKRRIIRITQKWKEIVQKNKRKRKAMDCSPIWIDSRTVEQSAQELYTTSQDLTLKLRKRYKYGRHLDIELPRQDKVNKVNLFQLTYHTLNQRFFDLRGILQKTIFWKVEISLPDHYELRNGLNRIEDALKEAFRWEDRNGTIMAIEQTKPNPVQTVTYCIERQRGLYVRYADANGIIFVAKDFNNLLQRRIFENLKHFGVFTKIPIVIILEAYDKGKCDLKTLIDQEIVSDYIILVDNLTPSTLINLIEEGLIFLASKVEKQPPVELDTLQSFITKYLCTEVWKRANSFAKWNSHYKNCLKDPNVVIKLYNEGLAKLRKIVFNKSCLEYAAFPEVFREYLDSQIPDCLPCNYYYFPKFWNSEAYVAKLETILDQLALPEWGETWPPNNELDLEVNISKYCVKVYKEPGKPFYKVMSVLLRDVDPNANFGAIKNVLWTDVVEVLSLEKLSQVNLSFTGTAFETRSVFNQYVVVYHADTLEEYKHSDWFYVNNPLVKSKIDWQLKGERKAEKKRDVKYDLGLDVDLDKTIDEVASQFMDKRNTLTVKTELAQFTALMGDLETSIKIHKKISSTFEDNLRRAIEDN